MAWSAASGDAAAAANALIAGLEGMAEAIQASSMSMFSAEQQESSEPPPLSLRCSLAAAVSRVGIVVVVFGWGRREFEVVDLRELGMALLIS